MPILSTRAGASATGYGWGALSGSTTSFESISSAVGTGSSGTITLSSIPGTYKHLQLRIVVAASSGDCGIRVNGAAGTSYARHVMRGSGSGTGSAFGVASTDVAANLFPGGISTTPASAIIDIMDYANAQKFKTFRIISAQENNTSGYVEVCSGLYISGSAITSISVINVGASWNTNTFVSLYGIKGAA
jgi:hypothetical protein